ncbi:acyl-CoA dehydrogenase family protein [Endozoicomonas sp.]|uniref:acyl-CoA dehydrogenase family protein n=1 Tax=Endozoicomonas sp. TaxID=1892382 RepID=UPI0028868B03|nr:acyl-CoA dehydrogenase family protein [Endozoicomonas sp.]
MPRKIFNEDHEQFRTAFRSFVEKEIIPHQEQWEEDGIIDRDLWRKAGEHGFLVPMAEEKYGGLGIADHRFDAVMFEELARVNERGFMLGLHNMVVAPYLISHGTEEQKQRLLSRCTSGDAILAIAMTEPGAGSDLASMRTHAEEKDDHWLLNGSKIFTSNGILSDIVVVAAKTNPDHPHEMGLFLVERGMEGFSRGKPLKKMGMKSQDTSELFFDNVKIPKNNVLGDPAKGFIYMMEKLPAERLYLCIDSVASARAALDLTKDYVKGRVAFGQPVSKFQNTQFKMAEMKTEIDLGFAYVDRMIELINDNKLSAADACGGKYWTSDMLCRVVDECLQLHGGYGFMDEYPISKMYRDVRISRIYAGTNEIMKTVIAKAMEL